jgi:hypothetical protein
MPSSLPALFLKLIHTCGRDIGSQQCMCNLHIPFDVRVEQKHFIRPLASATILVMSNHGNCVSLATMSDPIPMISKQNTM